MAAINARSFRDLLVWQKAHKFVLDVYQKTKQFPADERFGLTSQFRRAAVSVPANIAEGFRRLTPADKLRMFNIAEGSLEECRYYSVLASDLKYSDTTALSAAIDEVGRLLHAYMQSLRVNHHVQR